MNDGPAKNDWRSRLAALRLTPCRPPLWARGGHAQTMIAHFAPSPKPAKTGESVLIPLDDGDRLAATYYPGDSDVILYLFHGLAGSEDADYIQRMVRVAQMRGWRALTVNHRGCGRGRGLAAQPYHSGRADDLAAAIRHGRQRFPGLIHLAVGFSMSGNALLLLGAGQRGGDTPPDFGIAVNAPIDLRKTVLAVKRGLSRFYDARFAIKCRRTVLQLRRDGLLRPEARVPPPWSTLHGFDKLYTAPEGGFRDRDDYYETCSAKRWLNRVATPMAMLTAADDPMVDCADYQSADLSPCLFRHIEPAGGHMGYLTAQPTPMGNRRWLDYALDHMLAAYLGPRARNSR